jgi:hypothetical protein
MTKQKLKTLKVKISKDLYEILKEDTKIIDDSLDGIVEMYLWMGLEKMMQDCENDAAIKNSGKHL